MQFLMPSFPSYAIKNSIVSLKRQRFSDQDDEKLGKPVSVSETSIESIISPTSFSKLGSWAFHLNEIIALFVSLWI